jgi:hypothetical protein
MNQRVESAMRVLQIKIFAHLEPSIYPLCQPLIDIDSVFDAGCEAVEDMHTWRPEGTVDFTLVKAGRGRTLVYCHYNDTVFYASEAAQLHKDCPEGTAFLCQYCEDEHKSTLGETDITVNTTRTPHLLVYDILLGDMSPTQRNVLLRTEYERFLPKPLCTVQWVGAKHVLNDNFISSLPHKVDGLMQLTRRPRCVIRERLSASVKRANDIKP